MTRKIEETGSPLPEDTARELFRQIVRAVEYMHHQGVVSRDIKLDNLLVDTSQEPPIVKLCDFGLSKSKQESQPKSRVGSPQYLPPEGLQPRTRHPKAPLPACFHGNLAKGGPIEPRGEGQPTETIASSDTRLKVSVAVPPVYPVILQSTYDGNKADIWNCGVVLFAMVTGYFPFQRIEDMQLSQTQQLQAVVKRVVAGDYVLPGNLSPECGNMIANLLAVDPVRRLGLSDVQRHVFFVQGLEVGWFEESAALRDGKREKGSHGGNAEGSSARLAASRQTTDQIANVFEAAARALESSGEYVDPLSFGDQQQLTEEEEELLMDADLEDEDDWPQ